MNAQWRHPITIDASRKREAARAAGSVRQAAEENLGDLDAEIRRTRVLMVAAAVLLPLIATAVLELQESGKMQPNAVSGIAALTASVVACNGVILWRRHQHQIAPMKKRVEEILSAL
jgi:hypothetical protein